ncbi:hypothetical protein BH11PSE3_BH11PSE3_44760 [soil metagenome]
MINWLYSLPDILVVGLAAATLAALVTLLPRLVRRVPILAPGEASTDFVLRVQATLFTMCALILTFTLAEADGNFRRVDALVSAEASQIDRLDRLLFRYGHPTAVETRKHLRAYTKSIIDEEWPAMLAGGESEKTRLAFAPVSRAILSFDPSPGRQVEIYAEMLRTFNAVAESRDARLNAVSIGLPTIYWCVVLFAASMLLFVSSTIHRTRFSAIILACQMAVLGGFIGFAFVSDQPFKGATGVDTSDHVRALKRMDNRVP